MKASLYTLFDDQWRNHLLPLTFTRPVSELRCGILTIREKWERLLNTTISSWKTEDYLSEKYPQQEEKNQIFLNGHCCANATLAAQVATLNAKQGLRQGELIIAFFPENGNSPDSIETWIEITEPVRLIQKTWQLFHFSKEEMEADFQLLTHKRKSAAIPETVQTISSENIFIEAGAKLNFVTINASSGPVYIGCNTEIMEGTTIRGPFALCEHATVNMGARIYGPVTIGPHSKVGGELNTVIIHGYSNKGHDGFLGHSYIGEWCNLGASTNTSNLKNDYSEVKLWNYPSQRFLKTGLQFCGLIMGDHSKSGIQTMFNSGTVIGVGCNIHGSGYPRNFVPSFSNGGTHGFEEHPVRTVLNTAEKVMARRNVILTETDKKIITSVFEQTKIYRRY